MPWSPSQYMKFEDERTRAARDLLVQVPDSAGSAGLYDLGCGPGNSTELVAARFPDAAVTGIDSDANMVEAARARLPQLTFEQAPVETWRPPAPAGLLFANAVFQWVPEHIDVLARLAGELVAGGALAVQMPDNVDEPSHLLMEEVAQSAPFEDIFGGHSVRRSRLPPPDAYRAALGRAGCRVDLWHTIYYHPLADAAAIVEWVKATGLRPYTEAITDAGRRAEFLAQYLARIAAAYPPQSDGRVLLRFPRFFVVAVQGV